MQSRTVVLSTILFVSVLIAISCKSDPFAQYLDLTPTLDSSFIDKSLLTNIPCEAPCWYELKLGESTEQDVLTVLQGLSFLDKNTIRESSVGYWDPIQSDNIPAKLISANCVQPQNRQCVGLTIANNNLKIIGLFPNYEITFDEALDHLGSPDYISANPVPPIHSPGCSIGLIWVDHQIVLDHTKKSEMELCDDVRSGKGINRSLLVHSIIYFLPEYIDLQVASSETYPWVGFTNP